MRNPLVGMLLLATSFAAQTESAAQPQVWQDADTGAVFVTIKAPPTREAQSIRDQTAGVLDSWLAKPCLPLEFGQTTLGGLPTFYLRGLLLVEPESQNILVFVAFAEDQTYIGSVT